MLRRYEDTGFINCKPAILPMDPNLKVSSHEGDLLPNPSQNHRLIRRLLYVVVSWLNTCFTVNIMVNPKVPHVWMQCIIYSQRRTLTKVSYFPLHPLWHLKAYADADRRNRPDTHRLTTDSCIFFLGIHSLPGNLRSNTVTRSSDR